MKTRSSFAISEDGIMLFDFLWLSTILVYWKLPRGVGFELYAPLQMAMAGLLLAWFLLRWRYKFRPLFSSGGVASVFEGWSRVLILFGVLCLSAFVRAIVANFLNSDLYYALSIFSSLFFWLIYSAYVFCVILAYRDDQGSLRRITLFIFWGFGFYVTFNLAAYLAGTRSPNPVYLAVYPSQLLSFLGIESTRVLFPFADGINSFAISSGSVFMLLFPAVFASRDKAARGLGLIFLLSTCAVIVMSDSRGAILFLSIVLLFGLLPLRFARPLMLAAIVTSLLPGLGALFFADALAIETSLRRPGGSLTEERFAVLEENLCEGRVKPRLTALSNREIVWAVTLDEFRHPKLVHLVGYGYRGQVEAGISEQLSCVFLTHVYRDFVSVHNVWLQVLVETGYIGLIAALLLTYETGERLARFAGRDDSGVYRGMFFSLIYMIFAGTLESTLSPDYYVTFALFIVLLLFAWISPHDFEYQRNRHRA
jgi:hypothetical protein